MQHGVAQANRAGPITTPTRSIFMPRSAPTLKPRSVQFGRPLLAWRPNPSRGSTLRRALFAVHCNRPQLIAAWHRADSLDAAKVQQLWEAHTWQLLKPPADVAKPLAAGEPLQAIPPG